MWVEEIRKELTEHIVPFWLSMEDDENGGFYGYLSYDLALDKKADKGCILNSRILWFFSHVYKFFLEEYSRIAIAALTKEEREAAHTHVVFEGNEKAKAYTIGDLKDAAERAYRFLKQAMLDFGNGGVYWSVTCDGLPADTLKHTYNQAFAIYGLSAYYEISEDAGALDIAYGLMDVIENKCRDAGGYLEAFTIDFKPHSNEELSENGVEAVRTMNSLLHVFEGYSELYRVDCNENVRERLKAAAQLFMEHFYNPEKTRQEVFFDHDYRSLIDLHSYGHDIETSWLMEQGIDLLGDPQLNEIMKPAFRAMEEHTYASAFDGTAFINECENGVDDTKRIWWVQCEAIIGFTNRAQHELMKALKEASAAGEGSADAAGDLLRDDRLGEISPDAAKYLHAAETIWSYVREHIVDTRDGSEWLSEVNVLNEAFSRKPIVEEWKCPYHNGRMCLEILKRLS